MKSWSKGRIAILGDAAYCATPISGMGTTLAIVGAYVLAKSLSTYSSYAMAFAKYEEKMRPYVNRAQHYSPLTIRLEQPETKLGIDIFYALKKLDQFKYVNTVKSIFNTNKYDPKFLEINGS